MDYMVADFKSKTGIDLSGDKMAMERIKAEAEDTKKKLSSATQVEINIPFITANEQGPQHLNMTLTKAKFDELTRDLVERTAIPVQNALKDAGISASELSKVLLVGGSTRIPAVQDKVKQLTGHEPSKKMNPDECVALGASIQGGKLAGDAGAGDILLLDVTPLSLSIETMGGVATRLIERKLQQFLQRRARFSQQQQITRQPLISMLYRVKDSLPEIINHLVSSDLMEFHQQEEVFHRLKLHSILMQTVS